MLLFVHREQWRPLTEVWSVKSVLSRFLVILYRKFYCIFCRWLACCLPSILTLSSVKHLIIYQFSAVRCSQACWQLTQFMTSCTFSFHIEYWTVQTEFNVTWFWLNILYYHVSFPSYCKNYETCGWKKAGVYWCTVCEELVWLMHIGAERAVSWELYLSNVDRHETFRRMKKTA